VLREQPDHFDALHLHGVAALQCGLTEAGLDSIRKAIGLNTTIAAAHVSLGNGLRDLGRPREAIASYDTALSLDPDHAQGWHNRGNALVDLGRYEAAITSFDKAISLRPDFAEAYNGRGNALWKLKQPEQAVASYDRALALRRDLAVAYHNRGNILPYLNRPDEALASQDRAIALQPGLAEAHSSRGNVLWELGRPEEALASYHRAVTLKPGYADANWNASLCLLQLGRFEPEWRLFEWRKRLDEPMGLRDLKQPLWTGEQDVSGATLFLYWEQGLGDTIQFCRYAKLAAARGAQVIMEVQAPLARLLGGLGSGISVIVAPEELPVFDYHCPLMSLPLAFRTELATIPAEHHYLRVEDDIRARWSTQIGSKTKPRIGLVWAGGAAYGGDRKRSTDLTTCLPLIDLDMEWICLQKEIGDQDAAVLSDARRIAFFGNELLDFSDTAGLVDLLDLVITVDTSVAHLAAAMGKPVWIMLPYSSDWRWLRDRDDSPWYPTVRLFRQQFVEDWPGVINRVADALRTWLAARADEARRWFRRGNALLAEQRSEEALASYDTAIILNPGDPDAYTNRGNALLQLKRHADAVASYDAAIAGTPGDSLVFHNRGNALLDMRHPAAAVASNDRAIALNPNVAETHGARGNALWELRRPEEALASFRTAMALKPDYADAVWNASLCLLQMGRLEEGLRLFEWRKKLDLRVAVRSYPQPLWSGEQDIAGKTLFVYWEQGLDDTIQFCRYAKLAEDRGAKVIMEVQPPLYRLLTRISASIQVLVPDETSPNFDFRCPMLSLPLAFRTLPETIPATQRYLWAEAERRAKWAHRLGPRRKPRIGVVWAGSPGHRHDRDRSMDLRTFSSMFTDDADWVCLQKDLRESDRAVPDHLAFFGDALADFTDTAALVDLMDLVITVDTSVAHLAAAMGKAVWILLPYSPDWRWFLERDDTPWYPTVKLFRQQSHGDWNGVIDRVRRALQAVL
jgi:tetratricopeptide (TPR) repeat protein